jgi:hypothetical protein
MFSAVVILLSVLHKQYVHDYWRKRPVMQTGYGISVGVFCELSDDFGYVAHE